MDQEQLLSLSAVERSAIEIGLHDANNSWRFGAWNGPFISKLRRLVRKISGERGDLPLADAKLELLRQFVLLTRRQHRPAGHLIPALINHGYRANQIRSLIAVAA